MRKFFVLFVIASFFYTLNAADYPLISYEELEDDKPVDNEAWDNLTSGLFFTWGSKDVHYSYKNVPDVEYRTDTAIYAWRGERVSALALIYSKDDYKNLKVTISKFVKNSESIATESSVNFVNYVMTDALNADGNGTCGARPDHTRFDSSMVADVIDNQPLKDLKPRHVRPVWCSLEIPRDITPGDYTVTVKLNSGRTVLGNLTMTVHVLERTLPMPEDFVFHLDLWQQPYSVSRYYKLEKWSPEHFEAMRPMMKSLARIGQKAISAEIIYEPWGDQSHDKFDPMIETIKKSDGTWSYDYTIFDKWVEFMMDCGIDKEIKCFSMVPWDMSFRYYDEATSSYKTIVAQTSSAAYRNFWTPLLTSFAAHLREKGWYDITTICMDERGLGAMLDAYNLLQTVVPGMKMSLAGSYHSELVDKLYDYSIQYGDPFSASEIESRQALGRKTTLYTSCSSSAPNSYTFSLPAELTCLPLHAMQRGFDGFLRWAYNNWGEDPLRDTRYRLWGAGDSYFIYPGFRSSVRFERFSEGVQDAEKIRILREDYSLSGNSEALERLEIQLGKFAQGQITSENAGTLVRDLERILNEEPILPPTPQEDYCEVGLSASGKSAAIKNRWLTSVTTTGLTEELSYTSSSPSTDGYVLSPAKISVERGSSFSLNAKATINSDDMRYTRATIYADWNGDKVFNTFGKEVVSSFGKAAEGTMDMLDITSLFEVPEDAAVGEQRIRLRYADAWDEEPAPCGYNIKGFTFDIPMFVTAGTGVEVDDVSEYAMYRYTDGTLEFKYPTDVTVFSAGGGVLCQEKNISTLRTNGYSRGTYIIKIKQNGKTSNVKIVL